MKVVVFDEQLGRSPLIMAGYEGHTDVVTELLNHGADTDVADQVWDDLLLVLILIVFCAVKC